MACIRKRRGVWAVDAYVHGRRVVRYFDTRRQAEAAMSGLIKERQQRTRPAVDPFVSFEGYVPRFLTDCRDAQVSPLTLNRYVRCFENHLLPAFGRKRIRDIARADVRTFLLSKGQEGSNLQGQKGRDRSGRGALAKNTVKQLRSVLSALLSLAVDDEIITSNPALGVWRERRTKAARKAARARAGETVKAMTRDERNAFLRAAERVEPDVYPALMLMALAGLRLGEALGLKWPSVDFEGKRLDVHEQIGSDSTKTGERRTVDMSQPLADVLKTALARRRADAFRSGLSMSAWVVFPWLDEKPGARQQQVAEKRVRRGMARVLKAAGMSAHFTPHSLRHTFCSLLISQGESPIFVQQQAGHASVEMTVSVYGSWFGVEAPGAMDRLATGLPVAEPTEPVAVPTPLPEQPLLPTGTCGRGTPTRPSPA